MDLSLTEMRKTRGGGDLCRKIQNLVVGVLSLRCLLDIQVEMANESWIYESGGQGIRPGW